MQQIANSHLTYGCDNDIVFYNLVGNFIPPEWHGLNAGSGKKLSKTARQLLSLIVYCMQTGSNHTEEELQESYYFFEQQLGVCQRRVRQCLLELQVAGFITLYSATIIKHHIKCRNTLCIKLAKKFQPYIKKLSGEPENYCSPTRNNFRDDYIIDNSISKLESRYEKSDFEKNNFKEKQQLQTDPAKPSGWLEQVADKAKTWCTRKKLAEFHPLTEEDAEVLQIRSGREFNLNFINKLLLKLSEQYPSHSFFNKNSVINYMAKALTHEMRDAVKVNNEAFRFKSDDEIRLKEKYLEEIEYSRDTSSLGQLKRKITAVLNRDEAYQLLTSCRFFELEQNCFKFELLKTINIPEYTKSILLEQVQAIYGKKIIELEVIPPIQAVCESQDANMSIEDTYSTLDCLDPKSVWFKARKSLIEWYGVAIDKSWFSKLEAINEDSANKKVILKPTTAFIGNWVRENYDQALIDAFKVQDYTFEMTTN